MSPTAPTRPRRRTFSPLRVSQKEGSESGSGSPNPRHCSPTFSFRQRAVSEFSEKQMRESFNSDSKMARSLTLTNPEDSWLQAPMGETVEKRLMNTRLFDRDRRRIVTGGGTAPVPRGTTNDPGQVCKCCVLCGCVKKVHLFLNQSHACVPIQTEPRKHIQTHTRTCPHITHNTPQTAGWGWAPSRHDPRTSASRPASVGFTLPGRLASSMPGLPQKVGCVRRMLKMDCKAVSSVSVKLVFRA